MVEPAANAAPEGDARKVKGKKKGKGKSIGKKKGTASKKDTAAVVEEVASSQEPGRGSRTHASSSSQASTVSNLLAEFEKYNEARKAEEKKAFVEVVKTPRKRKAESDSDESSNVVPAKSSAQRSKHVYMEHVFESGDARALVDTWTNQGLGGCSRSAHLTGQPREAPQHGR